MMRIPPILTALISLSICVGHTRAASIYDLSADWSDATNPNGVWSYNYSQGVAFPIHLVDWEPSAGGQTHFAGPQPAWANQPGHVPMWFKSVGVTAGTFWNLDIPAGRVGMHGIESSTRSNVTWTSPISGTIGITGGVWLMRNLGRNMDWRILVNGTPITGERLLFSQTGTFNSGNPFDYSLGTGGSGALSQAVGVGDVISLELFRQNSWADFVGVDLTITAQSGGSVVPAPAPWMTLPVFSIIGVFVMTGRTMRRLLA